VFDPAVADAFGLKLGECVVTIHCGSRGLGHQIGTEEAPGAYKDVTAVIDAAEQAGLARKVARLAPLICIKG
jgi:RNA-splicing ligase RtcB